jgi:hypothetical protein
MILVEPSWGLIICGAAVLIIAASVYLNFGDYFRKNK